MAGLEMKYFVLNPHSKTDVDGRRITDKYAKASREAMRQYARAIKEIDSVLASELEVWADNEMDLARAVHKCDKCGHKL